MGRTNWAILLHLNLCSFMWSTHQLERYCKRSGLSNSRRPSPTMTVPLTSFNHGLLALEVFDE